MQEIPSSSPPVVPGICDQNKSRAWHRRSLKQHLKFFEQEFCSSYFSNSHVTEIKNLIVWISDFVTFVQISFGLSMSTSLFLEPFHYLKSVRIQSYSGLYFPESLL